jgi:hypothetical protein
MIAALGFSSLNFFALFVPLADVAEGGDGAKSAFRDHSCFLCDLCALLRLFLSSTFWPKLKAYLYPARVHHRRREWRFG